MKEKTVLDLMKPAMIVRKDNFITGVYMLPIIVVGGFMIAILKIPFLIDLLLLPVFWGIWIKYVIARRNCFFVKDNFFLAGIKSYFLAFMPTLLYVGGFGLIINFFRILLSGTDINNSISLDIIMPIIMSIFIAMMIVCSIFVPGATVNWLFFNKKGEDSLREDVIETKMKENKTKAKKCPFCDGELSLTAIRCKYCRHVLPGKEKDILP